MSITYPPVTGPVKNGREVTVAVGDLVTGFTEAGKLVTGRVIATHQYYPSLTIDGLTGLGLDIETGRYTVHLDKVLAHERQPVAVGQRVS